VFWYKNINNNLEFDIEKGYMLLSFIKSLAISQSSSILSEQCKYYYALTSRNIVQKLPFPTTNKHYAHVILLLIFLYQNTSRLTHDSCNTASLLNNALTVKASHSPFRSLCNTFNNSQLLVRFIFSRKILCSGIK
jgi:hypothetical protein